MPGHIQKDLQISEELLTQKAPQPNSRVFGLSQVTIATVQGKYLISTVL